MDIGAFNGDSAVVLMDYVKDVYSFEPSLANFQVLEEIIRLNQNRSGQGYAINLAFSDMEGERQFDHRFSPMSSFKGRQGVAGEGMVRLTTLDKFLEGRDLKVGFVKCDTEGYGMPILRGAEGTLKKDRPIVSFAVYHNFEEFFGIPPLLQKWLPDYEFGWEFLTDCLPKWHELIFLGYPKEIMAES
jgi:FkbM family methyltransferase